MLKRTKKRRWHHGSALSLLRAESVLTIRMAFEKATLSTAQRKMRPVKAHLSAFLQLECYNRISKSVLETTTACKNLWCDEMSSQLTSITTILIAMVLVPYYSGRARSIFISIRKFLCIVRVDQRCHGHCGRHNRRQAWQSSCTWVLLLLVTSRFV